MDDRFTWMCDETKKKNIKRNKTKHPTTKIEKQTETDAIAFAIKWNENKF